MFYGALVWDPWLIVAQIVSLQCMYYLTVGFFMSVLVGTRVERMSLVYFFDFSTLTVSTVTGCYVVASFLLGSLVGAVYMLYVIERAKKCLDFSATLYIIHLFICIIYGGWPASLTWWVVNLVGLAIMTFLGEWLCIKRESKEIPITRLRSTLVYLGVNCWLRENTNDYRRCLMAIRLKDIRTSAMYLFTMLRVFFIFDTPVHTLHFII